MRLLFSDDIPDPRDIVIVSLAAASDVFSRILSREELAEAQSRIDLISGMDLIGQSVARAVAQQPMASLPSAPSARSPEEIPMVSGWPLVGSALDMAGDLRSFLTRQYRELGPIFQVRALKPALYRPRRPGGQSPLFRSGGEIFLRSYESWRAFNNALGAKDTLIGMDGAAHVRMRKVHSAGFSRGFIEDRLDEVVDITRGMVAEWPRDRSIVAQYAMPEPCCRANCGADHRRLRAGTRR